MFLLHLLMVYSLGARSCNVFYCYFTRCSLYYWLRNGRVRKTWLQIQSGTQVNRAVINIFIGMIFKQKKEKNIREDTCKCSLEALSITYWLDWTCLTNLKKGFCFSVCRAFCICSVTSLEYFSLINVRSCQLISIPSTLKLLIRYYM